MSSAEAKIPADLRRILASSARANSTWKTLTPLARRDFISWIVSAKLPETRRRRVESVPSRLASGKRRPCCYAIVPMNLYKTLGQLPRAKKQWSSLSADEKRDFVDQINAADPSQRPAMIEKTCAALLMGKCHP